MHHPFSTLQVDLDMPVEPAIFPYGLIHSF